jgi:helicase SWR1
LDAILDQSEQILETQQVALTRADHSRSGSVSSGVTSDSDDNHRMGAEVDSEGGGDIELESVDSDDETDPGLESLLSITFLQRRRVHRKRRRQPSSAGASSVRSGSTEEQSRPSSPPTHISALSNLDHHGDSTTPVDDPMPPMVEDPLHNLPALSSSSSTTSHPSPPKPPDISDNEDEAHLLGEVNARSHSPASSIGIALWPVASLDLPCSPKTVDLSVASSPPPSQPDNLDAEPPPEMPEYLRAFATAAVRWDPEAKIQTPFLLRGTLRPYQQAGLEWLVSLHNGNTNGILADEMGLGYVFRSQGSSLFFIDYSSRKTIQTISLLAHLACNRGIWGPHLIIVPTSVILNWEMEFKKFLPGFKVLAYHGTAPRRKEIRKGWTSKNLFNVCITSYQLAAKDASIFKRKPWYYMILDEAHMIKNFKSQRWNTLLAFRSFRRLLLTGTPLQNNLTELWALLQFMMSGSTFAGLSEFHEWFSSRYILDFFAVYLLTFLFRSIGESNRDG